MPRQPWNRHINHSAVAKSVDEARKLVEEGFEYVCQKDDLMLFRKRK